ncbi:MAG: MBL fold metallo-hydrolase [Myxococcota bacterium]
MSRSLFDLPITLTSEWIFNCYLLESDDGIVAFDPGLPSVARKARRWIDQEGRPLTALLCTHGHPDHLAGIEPLRGAEDIPVYMPKRFDAYLQGEVPRMFPLVDSSLRLLPVLGEQPFSFTAIREFAAASDIGFGQSKTFQLPFQPSGFVSDGKPLPMASDWEVIETPGHSDCSTSYYHRATETLISGDAVVTQDGAPWFNPEYVDLDLCKQTEERLRALPVRHLLPGHGPPLAAPNVWDRAKSCTAKPTGNSILARCARTLVRWPHA